MHSAGIYRIETAGGGAGGGGRGLRIADRISRRCGAERSVVARRFAIDPELHAAMGEEHGDGGQGGTYRVFTAGHFDPGDRGSRSRMHFASRSRIYPLKVKMDGDWSVILRCVERQMNPDKKLHEPTPVTQ